MVIAKAGRTGNCRLMNEIGMFAESGDAIGNRGMRTCLPACAPVRIVAFKTRCLISVSMSLVPLASPEVGGRQGKLKVGVTFWLKKS